jgi:hypothetical protein
MAASFYPWLGLFRSAKGRPWLSHFLGSLPVNFQNFVTSTVPMWPL